MDNELLAAKIAAMEAKSPFGREGGRETVSPSTSRSYRLARGRARVGGFGRWRLSFSQANDLAAITRRRRPTGPCLDADLADHIRQEIDACDLMENGLLAYHRVGRNPEKTHDGTIVSDKSNERGERT
jgi:hypothetical protein